MPHPDLRAEQAYIDHAHACLEQTREAARRLNTLVEVGAGGTNQARFEREVFVGNVAQRLAQLHLGDAALCFGRIDLEAEFGAGGEVCAPRYYVGRIAVADTNQEPLIVDWRAPVAEPFYRATGRQPMGLALRRHFAERGRTLVAIEDELFGVAALGLDAERDAGAGALAGRGALLSALEERRTGRLSDIVATIQAEQDEIIRGPLPGVLVVQGGPGSGKTVVALHRAAYLLYTHRFPLEGQGVLVVGPSGLFLGYIEHVLPSLGEVGVQLATLADLLRETQPGLCFAGADRGLTARVKGDERMEKVLARAVKDRQRPLRGDLVVGFGLDELRLTVADSRTIVRTARRRHRTHNAGRRYVESAVFETLAASGRYAAGPEAVRDALRRTPEVRAALEWMWPTLTPAELLRDLFGSLALLRSAADGVLSPDEARSLHRDRGARLDEVAWTADDAPLLDEAFARLGPSARRRGGGMGPGAAPGAGEEIRTFGHIVVDEAQDLSPMALRMLSRRSLTGSMTVVGDIAQATGAWERSSWDDVIALLPARKAPRRTELTLGYRIPAPIMELASRVLAIAAPEVTPSQSVRDEGEPPRLVRAGRPASLAAAAVRAAQREQAELGEGNLAVICPASLVEPVESAFAAAGIEVGLAARNGLERDITVVAVGAVKGLEVDAAVVLEPALIIAEERQGWRALYVALTRATKRLTVVHARPLPECFGADGDAA
ncbi:MAG: HelD family protein [Acidimicrobiales bacterium]